MTDVRWELNFVPAEGDTAAHAVVYQYTAGVCGPFDTAPAVDRLDAEALGLKHALYRTGEWELADNGFWHAPAAKWIDLEKVSA